MAWETLNCRKNTIISRTYVTQKTAEKAQNAWWEDRAEEAEKYEMAVKSGRGGSLLKDSRILQRSQTTKTNSALKGIQW